MIHRNMYNLSERLINCCKRMMNRVGEKYIYSLLFINIHLHMSCWNECKAQNFGEVALSLNRYQQLSTLLGCPIFLGLQTFI